MCSIRRVMVVCLPVWGCGVVNADVVGAARTDCTRSGVSCGGDSPGRGLGEWFGTVLVM